MGQGVPLLAPGCLSLSYRQPPGYFRDSVTGSSRVMFCTCVDAAGCHTLPTATFIWPASAERLLPALSSATGTSDSATVNNTCQQNFTFFLGTRGKISNPNRAFKAEFKCVSSFSPSPTVCL